MSTRVQELEDRASQILSEMEKERERQAVNDALNKLTEKVGATIIVQAKESGLELKHLHGNLFRCELQPRTGEITVELVAKTAFYTTQIAKATLKVMDENPREFDQPAPLEPAQAPKRDLQSAKPNAATAGDTDPIEDLLARMQKCRHEVVKGLTAMGKNR